MKIPFIMAAALAAAALSAPASAQGFTLVPDAFTVSDITPDGSVVVGYGNGGAFYWDRVNDPAPIYIGGSTAVAVSDDGKTILGHMYDPPTSSDTYAGIWTQLGGWVSLGTLGSCGSSNSSPLDLSGDGLVAVGLTWAGCSGAGFRWTAATGMEYLSTQGNGQNRANVVSNNGNVIGGFAQGSSTRTPAMWAGDLTGFVYDMDANGEISGLNNDGSTVLGFWDGDGFILDTTSFTSIGSMNSGWTGRPQAITEDGKLVAGFDTELTASEAWLWKQATGFVAMDDALVASGIVGAPAIYQNRAMTDNGNIIVGQCQDPTGLGLTGFIFEFDTDGSWEDVGSALAGTNGEPSLQGSGALLPFASVTVSLTNGLPSGNAYMIIGLSSLNAPFKGGVLVPSPDMILGPLSIDGAGNLDLSTFWPSGVPSGFVSYYQYWIPDAGGPNGYAASNGLTATSP